MRLSVIIPAHNCVPFLRRCVAALRASRFADYECICVDDGSTDDTAAAAESYGVRVLRLRGNGGPARARNRGAEIASGEILAFIDSDVCVHPDTLSRIDQHFRAHPQCDAVMGSYDDTPADPSFLSQYKNLFHHYVHQRSRTEAWTFWAGCGAIRREVFQAFGGFDESYTRPCIEDIELGNRMHAAGRRIDLNRDIQVTHLKRWTLWDLIRTDVRDRGAPWLLLMRRNRSMPADLNVTVVQRLSVAIVGVALSLVLVLVVDRVLGSPATRPVTAVAEIVAIAAGALLLYLNRDFYRFLAGKRGWQFALRTVPLHWLYHLYCGASVLLALAAVAWERLTGRQLVAVPKRKLVT
jgi:glycosyltransferase involved in cell wall biosynthesis